MISVNTNTGAMIALQTLAHNSNELARTQAVVSSGLKVASVKDNGAIWAIANKLGADANSYDRIIESTERAESLLDVSIAVAEQVSSIMDRIKQISLASQQPGLSSTTRAAFDAEYQSHFNSIWETMNKATFDGSNMMSLMPSNARALGDADGNNSIVILGSGDLGISVFMASLNPGTDAGAVFAAAAVYTWASNAFNSIQTTIARWGAGVKRMELHNDFALKIQANLQQSVGALIEADMAKESAKLRALQTKQELGISSLSIANSSTNFVLSLFPN